MSGLGPVVIQLTAKPTEASFKTCSSRTRRSSSRSSGRSGSATCTFQEGRFPLMPTESKIESEMSQRKSGPSVNFEVPFSTRLSRQYSPLLRNREQEVVLPSCESGKKKDKLAPPERVGSRSEGTLRREWKYPVRFSEQAGTSPTRLSRLQQPPPQPRAPGYRS